MATTTTDTVQDVPTTELRLSSGNGPITRTILKTPLRDALPSEIPVIDVSGAFSDSVADRKAVASRIRDAAMNNGFFYITDHGIPASVTEAAYAAYLDFFRQDPPAKHRVDAGRSVHSNGYRGPRTQRLNPDEGVDVRESFSWTYDPRHDPSVRDDMDAIPDGARRLMRDDPSVWEALADMPQLKEATVAYFGECLRVARALTRSFALSLDLDEDFFGDKVRYPDAAFSFNYYPPLDETGAESVSVGSHTDFQLFTMLWQDDQGGLQVLSRGGQWLRAPPREGTLVVNIADYLQRVTNGRYVSTVHRARNTGGGERVSIPFFWGFGLHESCGVLDSCVGEGEEKLYDEVSCEEWVGRRLGEMLKVGDKKG